MGGRGEDNGLPTAEPFVRQHDVVTAIAPLMSSGIGPARLPPSGIASASCSAFPANPQVQGRIMNRSFGQPLFDRSFANCGCPGCTWPVLGHGPSEGRRDRGRIVRDGVDGHGLVLRPRLIANTSHRRRPQSHRTGCESIPLAFAHEQSLFAFRVSAHGS